MVSIDRFAIDGRWSMAVDSEDRLSTVHSSDGAAPSVEVERPRSAPRVTQNVLSATDQLRFRRLRFLHASLMMRTANRED